MEIENTNLSTEQSADQFDAFMAGWDDDETPVTETADQPTEETAGEAAEQGETAEAEQSGEDAAEDGADGAEQSETTGEAAAETAGQQTEQDAPSWAIKHMGVEQTLGVKDITPELLQKGMDYDRIRPVYDEAKPVLDIFKKFAQNAGMSLSDYIKHIRTEALRAGGMSEDEAARSVALEDREAAVAAAEAEQLERANAEAKAKAKVEADLAEFAKAFPDVFKQAESDPKAIPESVWAQVNSGALSLTAAYSRYAVEQAQASAAAARDAAATKAKNDKNAARSTGSMKSAGNDVKTNDPFLDGWNS